MIIDMKDVRDVLEMQQHNTQMEFKKRKDEVVFRNEAASTHCFVRPLIHFYS